MKKQVTAFIAAVSILVSVLSVNVSVFAEQSNVPYDERTVAVEVDKINEAIKTFSEDLKKPNNKDKVFEDYYILLDLAARNGDSYNEFNRA